MVMGAEMVEMSWVVEGGGLKREAHWPASRPCFVECEAGAVLFLVIAILIYPNLAWLWDAGA